MGSRSAYQPHKLIVPVLFGAGLTLEEVERLVAETFGRVDSRSDVMDFTFTRYYDKEMGRPIARVLYSIDQLVDPGELAELKIRSNGVEAGCAAPDGRRAINLDPGLLSLTRLILATTKPGAHRIPIGMGIHAEVTLLYQRGAFQPLQWTYPDFQSQVYHQWLQSVRRTYHESLKRLYPQVNWRL